MASSAAGGGAPPVNSPRPFGSGGGPARHLFARVVPTEKGARLRVWFSGGPQGEWALEAKPGTPSINQRTLEAAKTFAGENGARLGQLNRIEKAVADAGYRF